jgi:hypothetical protein
MTVRDILGTHPRPSPLDRDLLVRCIDDCTDCAATCTSDADVCDATGRILLRQTEPDLGLIRGVIEACAVACRACGDECEKHASHHEHCRICAEVCRRCEQSCRDLLETI